MGVSTAALYEDDGGSAQDYHNRKSACCERKDITGAPTVGLGARWRGRWQRGRAAATGSAMADTVGEGSTVGVAVGRCVAVGVVTQKDLTTDVC